MIALTPKNWKRNDHDKINKWLSNLPIVKDYDEMLEIDKYWNLKKHLYELKKANLKKLNK